MKAIKCPVCLSMAIEVEKINSAQIAKHILLSFGDLNAINHDFGKYSMQKCTGCELVFSDPMTPGDDRFYEWICGSRFYYPAIRWEWAPCIDLLIKKGIKKVLDVGCGSGLFLAELKKCGIEGFGVDPNQDSVNSCTALGLHAECLSLEQIAGHEGSERRFEAITLFHVLEHLSDPAEAIKSAMKCLLPGGLIAVSVPYSPMTFESDWWDPLNRPPHHLTRWNESALKGLANSVGMSAEIMVQPASSLISRTLSTLQIKYGLAPLMGSSLNRGVGLIGRAITHPLAFVRIFIHQIQRNIQTGGPKGDAILMIMKIKN